MKFATTALALSLLTADAFMVQEHKNFMQPLNAESLIKHLSNSGDSPFTAPPSNNPPVVVKDTANSPFSPPKYGSSPSFSGVPEARTATQSNNSPVNGAVVKDTANSPFSSPKSGTSPFSPGVPGAPAARTAPVNGAGTVVKGTANSPFTSFKSGNSPFSPGGSTAPAAPAARTAPVNRVVVKGTANSPFTSAKSGNSPFSSGVPVAPVAPAAQMAPQSNNSPVATAVRDTANSPFTSPKFETPTIKTMAVKSTKALLEQVAPVEVQGGSLKTCSLPGSADRVTVLLTTRGRPLNANVELWQGPQNAPQQMAVYLEDGEDRPFRATIESPGSSNAISIRNTGQMELPLTAAIECEEPETTSPSEILVSNSRVRTIQGGAVYTTPFPPSVQSVQIALRTDGRPLQARVELLQGPNNNKQVMEVYTEDGDRRPFYVIVDTPGSGNVVRIVNTATVEFPLTAVAEAYMVEQESGIDSSNLTWS